MYLLHFPGIAFPCPFSFPLSPSTLQLFFTSLPPTFTLSYFLSSLPTLPSTSFSLPAFLYLFSFPVLPFRISRHHNTHKLIKKYLEENSVESGLQRLQRRRPRNALLLERPSMEAFSPSSTSERLHREGQRLVLLRGLLYKSLFF